MLLVRVSRCDLWGTSHCHASNIGTRSHVPRRASCPHNHAITVRIQSRCTVFHRNLLTNRIDERTTRNHGRFPVTRALLLDHMQGEGE